MIKLSACVVCGALMLYVAGTMAFADDSVAPMRLDPDKIAGLGLTAIRQMPTRTSSSAASSTCEWPRFSPATARHS